MWAPRNVAGRVLDGESEHLAVVLAGREAADAVQLAELLAAVAGRGALALRTAAVAGLHPGRSAETVIAGSVVGEVGEVDPVVLDRLGIDERVGWVRYDLGALLGLDASVPLERPVSRFPSTDIDLAFVTPGDVPADAVRRSSWRPLVSCWSPSSCSTCSAPSNSGPPGAAWRIGSACRPTTGPSPMPRWASCAIAWSLRSSDDTLRCSGPDAAAVGHGTPTYASSCSSLHELAYCWLDR